MNKIINIFLMSAFIWPKVVNSSQYFGADASTCKTCFKKNYGEEIFKERSIGSNLFIGKSLNETISIEVGYQKLKSNQNSIVCGGNTCQGIYVPPAIMSIVYKTEIKIHGPHIGIIAFGKKYNSKIQPFFGIGAMKLKYKFKRETMLINGFFKARVRECNASKIVPRAIIGFNYFLNSQATLRFSVTNIFTNNVKSNSNDQFMKIKTITGNTTCFSVGLVFQL